MDTTRVTDLLHSWAAGREAARDQCMERLYPEIRRVAGRILADYPAELSLQVTELVHETYMRLARQERASWHNRRHFLSVCAQLVRRSLVDHVRERRSLKRGGGATRVELDQLPPVAADADPDLLALHQALDRLEEVDSDAARFVELRYFVGLTVSQAAEVLGIGRTSGVYLWQFARAWLRRALTEV